MKQLHYNYGHFVWKEIKTEANDSKPKKFLYTPGYTIKLKIRKNPLLLMWNRKPTLREYKNYIKATERLIKDTTVDLKKTKSEW